METLKATLVGVAPLLMHNGQLADPTAPITRELKSLTGLGTKQKTDAVMEEIKRIEWRGGLNLCDKGEPCVTFDQVHAMIIAGAKKSKNGKLATAGVFPVVGKETFPLIYEGPRDIDALWKAGSFCDYRGVVVNGKRVMRSRPKFRNWTLTIEVNFEPDTINRRALVEALEAAGQLIGLGDMRPRMGRFLAEAA